jgi:hypothetical protein
LNVTNVCGLGNLSVEYTANLGGMDRLFIFKEGLIFVDTPLANYFSVLADVTAYCNSMTWFMDPNLDKDNYSRLSMICGAIGLLQPFTSSKQEDVMSPWEVTLTVRYFFGNEAHITQDFSATCKAVQKREARHMCAEILVKQLLPLIKHKTFMQVSKTSLKDFVIDADQVPAFKVKRLDAKSLVVGTSTSLINWTDIADPNVTCVVVPNTPEAVDDFICATSRDRPSDTMLVTGDIRLVKRMRQLKCPCALVKLQRGVEVTPPLDAGPKISFFLSLFHSSVTCGVFETG